MASEKNSVSIRIKLGLAIVAIFVLLIGALTSYSYYSQRQNNLDTAITQVRGMNAFYFDSLNTLMWSDGMEDREFLRQKMLEQPGVVDVRVIRGEVINKKFGPGFTHEEPVDELDFRALRGESVVEVSEQEDQRVLTVIEPYRLTKDTRGTDCLECHRRVEPGTVGGAIRLSYSLKAVDKLVIDEILSKFAVTLVTLLIGLAALLWVLNRVVLAPVARLGKRMKDIATGEGDLTQELNSRSNDEFGQLANCFNVFVSKIRGLVVDINDYVEQLSSASQHMNNVVHQTDSHTAQQQQQTSQVAQAMTEMNGMVQMVSGNASDAAQAAGNVHQQAGQGKVIVGDTISSINVLAEDVERAEQVIRKVEEESDNITLVLDVIRNIAEQTNMLALNAAIEAARAGEQGRGFAVVADEVRTLAERTHESTQEIQRMIESLQQGAKDAVQVMAEGKNQAGTSVDQVAKAGQALEAITAAIQSISDMNTQIAGTAHQHSHLSSEINQNVINISQQASATASEIADLTQSSERLACISADLKAKLGHFKT